MPYKILISLMVCQLAVHAYGQDSLPYHSKWQVNLSGGMYTPLTTLLKGDATDPLIQFNDRCWYWQVLSVSYFFHKHWGIAFNYQAGNSKNIGKKTGQFTASMQSEYGNDHYVTAYSGGTYDDGPAILGHIERGYLGVIYRLESKRFFAYPKLAIGVTSFYTNWGEVYLKQKNANDVIEIKYTPSKLPQDHFTLAASASFGYKLSRRIFINFEVLGSWYKTHFTYTKTTTDLNLETTETDLIPYKKNMLSLALGGGLIIVLK